MGFIAKVLAPVAKAVVWVAKWVVKALVWIAAHPAVGILVVIAAYSLAKWADEQSWWGANLVADLAVGFGYSAGVAVVFGWLSPGVGAVISVITQTDIALGRYSPFADIRFLPFYPY